MINTYIEKSLHTNPQQNIRKSSTAIKKKKIPTLSWVGARNTSDSIPENQRNLQYQQNN